MVEEVKGITFRHGRTPTTAFARQSVREFMEMGAQVGVVTGWPELKGTEKTACRTRRAALNKAVDEIGVPVEVHVVGGRFYIERMDT